LHRRDREAQATVVAAAQSSTSFIPPLGREKARVFTLNLRNRLIFRAADEDGALESADFLGKRRAIKKSWGYSGGKMSPKLTRSRTSKKLNPTTSCSAEAHGRRHPLQRGHRRQPLPPLEPEWSNQQMVRR